MAQRVAHWQAFVRTSQARGVRTDEHSQYCGKYRPPRWLSFSLSTARTHLPCTYSSTLHKLTHPAPTHSLTAAQALLERLQQDTSGDAAARAARADESLLEALPRCLAQASY